MTAVSKNVYLIGQMILLINTTTQFIELLQNKPIAVASDLYAEYNEDFKEKDLKFKVGHRLKISKNKNIFAKDILKTGQIKFLLLVK